MGERKILGRIDFAQDDDLTIAHALCDYIRSGQFDNASVYNVAEVLKRRTAAKVAQAEPALAARILLMKNVLERTAAGITDFLRTDERNA